MCIVDSSTTQLYQFKKKKINGQQTLGEQKKCRARGNGPITVLL